MTPEQHAHEAAEAHRLRLEALGRVHARTQGGRGDIAERAAQEDAAQRFLGNSQQPAPGEGRAAGGLCSAVDVELPAILERFGPWAMLGGAAMDY